MFRKTRFNLSSKDGQPNFLQELTKEFSGYFDRLVNVLKHLFTSHPRTIYKLMIAAMCMSILVYCYGRIFWQHDLSQAEVKAPITASYVLPGLLNTGANLSELLTLSGQVNGILSKQRLSASDSLELKAAFIRIEQIHQSINQNTKPKSKQEP